MKRMANDVREASRRFATAEANSPFGTFLREVRSCLGSNYSRSRAADDFAMAAVAVRLLDNAWKASPRIQQERIVELACRHPVCRSVWEGVSDLAQLVEATHVDPVYITEELLGDVDPQRRRETGVYFTPQPLAAFLIRRTEEVLRESFALDDGLATTDTPVNIIDPAMGSGVFLLEAVRRLRQHSFACASNDEWSAYVSEHLLPRLHGFEISPAPLVLAHFLVGRELIAGGYNPAPTDRLQFHLADTLAQPRVIGGHGELPVVIGNPPYRSAARNSPPWLANLVRGRAGNGSACASYYHVDGQPLRERKHWLHDDYVKFFRWAQWQVECADAGVIALVTNHGFLDNPTFRGMRSGLLETFADIELVDLHGNTNRLAAADDESVFATAQGMATTVAWRTPQANGHCNVLRGDLRGSRELKLNCLGEHASSVAYESVTPSPPGYFFCVHDTRRDDEYAHGHSIADIMPVNTTAVVTARDKLVIDIDRDELVRRLARFRDLSVSDDEIRRRFFPSARTTKYPPGDTRGWKLADARRRLARERDWQQNIRTCWYRPFDRRWIYWTPWMVDWPRQEVMRHLQSDSIALVCRRQMVRGRPCNFFWVADDIVIDGYIRSDNRGTESVFPLNLRDDERQAGPAQSVNFTTKFISAVAQRVELEFTPGEAASGGQFNARELLHYIYAVFHSASYRERFAEQLYVDFPRIPLPVSRVMFRRMSEHGEKLVQLHLLRGTYDPLNSTDVTDSIGRECRTASIQFASELVGALHESAWNFHVGTHQVLRKWLKDRRGRTLTEADMATYRRIAYAVQATLETMQEIEWVVQSAGGWARCFQATTLPT